MLTDEQYRAWREAVLDNNYHAAINILAALGETKQLDPVSVHQLNHAIRGAQRPGSFATIILYFVERARELEQEETANG